MLDHTQLTLSCDGGGHDRAGAFGDSRHRVFVVADGAGGAPGAAMAASFVVDLVGNVARDADGPIGTRGWMRVLERADRALLSSPGGGQTTAVIVEVFEDRLSGASVGDSGAWLVHEGHHLDLTAEQRRKWRLGSGRADPVSFGPFPLVGTLLLATDGLLDFGIPDALAEALDTSELEDGADALGRAVRLPSGTLRDDVAMVLCRWRPDPVSLRAAW